MHQLTIVNRTGIAISCHHAHRGIEDLETIQPSATITTEVPSLRLNLTLAPVIHNEKEDSTPIHDGWGSGLNGVVVGHSLTFGATWAVLKASEGSPWIIYRSKVLATLVIRVLGTLMTIKDYQRPPPSSPPTTKRHNQVLERHT